MVLSVSFFISSDLLSSSCNLSIIVLLQYRFALRWELGLLIIGLLMASVNGLFVPIGVIVYGEFTSLLIDRTTRVGTSTPCIILAMFGGCTKL